MEVLTRDLRKVLEYIVEKQPQRLTTAMIVDALGTLSTYRISWVKLKLKELGVIEGRSINIERAKELLAKPATP